MSKIEQLIQELCPGGVIYSKLGEVCRTKTPPAKLKTSDYQDIGLYPIIDQGQSVYAGYTDDERYLLPDAEYVLYGDHTCIIKYHKGSFAQGADGLKILIPIGQNVKYIYYALSAYNLTSTEYKRHWAQAKEIEIPLPPLPIQQEIVRILDTFTEAQANLEQELELRKKQYEYYRNQLLTFDENDSSVKWMKLEEVAEIGTGSGNTNEGLKEGLYPFYTRGQEVLRKNTYEYDETAVITAGDGVGVGKVMHFVKGKYALHQRAYRIHTNEEALLAKFFFYYMKKTFYDYIMQNSVFSSVNSIRKPKLLAYPIPVATIARQQEIVTILDKFESAIQTLEEELALRKKQYEYYREKLLTFN